MSLFGPIRLLGFGNKRPEILSKQARNPTLTFQYSMCKEPFPVLRILTTQHPIRRKKRLWVPFQVLIRHRPVYLGYVLSIGPLLRDEPYTLP